MKALQARLARLDRSLPRASSVDDANLRAAVDTLISVVESCASSQPGYRAAPSGESRYAWLESHLRSEAWQSHFAAVLTAELRAWIAFQVSKGATQQPTRDPLFAALDDVANALAGIEKGGALPPAWMPAALVSDARECWASEERIMGMNSEQRSSCMRDLLAKCGVAQNESADLSSGGAP